MPPQEVTQKPKQPAVDLDALAKQFGGQSAPTTNNIDLDALAQQFGGTDVSAPAPARQPIQPTAKPVAAPNTPESMVAAFNAGLAPYGAAALLGAPFGPVGMGITTGALGAADLVSMGYNALLAPLFGTPQIGTPSEVIRNELVKLMPGQMRMPETAEQRIAYGAGGGMGSAMNIGSALGSAARLATGGTKNVLTQLAGSPGVNAFTGATGGAAAQLAAEAGASPLVQAGVGFVGGLGGSLAYQGAKTGVSAVLNPKASQAQLSAELQQNVTAAYKGMEDAGVRYSVNSIRALLRDMEKALPGMGHDLTPPDIAQALRAVRAELRTAKGGVIGPKALNQLAKTFENNAGNSAETGRIIGLFKSMIDDFIGDSATSVNAKRANVSVIRSELNKANDNLNTLTPGTPEYLAQEQLVQKLTARNDVAIARWAAKDPATQKALKAKKTADEKLDHLQTLQGRGSASQAEVDAAELAAKQTGTKLAKIIEDVAPSDETAIKAAQDALATQNSLRKISNDLARRNFRSRELDELMEKVDIAVDAGRTMSTEIRNRLKALIDNKQFRRYATEEQIKMLRDAMRGSFASRTMEAVGTLTPSLRGIGGLAGSAIGLGGVSSGAPIAAAVPLVVAPAAKEAANMMAAARLGEAARRIKTGQPAPTFTEKNINKLRSAITAVGTQRSEAPTEEKRVETELKKLRTTKQPIPTSISSPDDYEKFSYDVGNLRFLAESILTDDKVASLYNLDDLAKLNEVLWNSGVQDLANEIAILYNDIKAAKK